MGWSLSLVTWSQRGFVVGFRDVGHVDVFFPCLLGASQPWAKKHGTQQRRRGSEDGSDDEGDMVSAVDGRHGGRTSGKQVVGTEGREAGEDGEAERTTHHERRVD